MTKRRAFWGWRAFLVRFTGSPNDRLLRFTGILGLLIFFWLATHQSKTAVVFGRYSMRYSLALAGISTLSISFMLLSIPRWRARLLKQRTRSISRRQAWGLIIVGWLALPLTFVLLRPVLPANDDRALTISFALLCEVAVIVGLLWWSGADQHSIEWRQHWKPLLGLIAIQILIVLFFHGSLPSYRLLDELFSAGSAWKQAHDLRNFTGISADRNAQSWANFSLIWPLNGIYMRIFGAGWLQARASSLLILWAASPFVYGIASRLYGRAAALIAFLLALAIPLHHNWALSHGYIATATVIALYAYLRSKQRGLHQHFWQFGCGFFALSAVEGHFYGLAFASIFGLMQLGHFYQDWRRGSPGAVSHFLAYVLGSLSFLVVWFAYHVLLADRSITEFPAIILETYSWEDALGERLSPYIIWKSIQLYAYINPFEVVILIAGVVLAFWRNLPEDRLLLFVMFGAFGIIGLVLAHINDYYFIFFMPFVCLFGGAGLVGKAGGRDRGKREAIYSISLITVFIILCVMQLFSIQAYEVSNRPDTLIRLAEQREKAAIGRAIDKLLPGGEIIIAGDGGYYTGMYHRLNYWITFSFTWGLPKYWPLDPPQAIIVTLGQDDGYSGLAEWLVEHDFQAIECYPIAKARNDAWAAILYTLPELKLSASSRSCTPGMLAWLDD